jgi:hypothetical protein
LHISLVGGDVGIGLAQVGFDLGQQGIDPGESSACGRVLDVWI